MKRNQLKNERETKSINENENVNERKDCFLSNS